MFLWTMKRRLTFHQITSEFSFLGWTGPLRILTLTFVFSAIFHLKHRLPPLHYISHGLVLFSYFATSYNCWMLTLVLLVSWQFLLTYPHGNDMMCVRFKTLCVLICCQKCNGWYKETVSAVQFRVIQASKHALMYFAAGLVADCHVDHHCKHLWCVCVCEQRGSWPRVCVSVNPCGALQMWWRPQRCLSVHCHGRGLLLHPPHLHPRRANNICKHLLQHIPIEVCCLHPSCHSNVIPKWDFHGVKWWQNAHKLRTQWWSKIHNYSCSCSHVAHKTRCGDTNIDGGSIYISDPPMQGADRQKRYSAECVCCVLGD